MDAGVPIKAPVAGISCGLIQDDDGSFTTFIDIQGVEDFHGEMDFKVAGTKKGITAIQMDLKNDGLTHGDHQGTPWTSPTMPACQILDEIMLPCIAEPRPEVSKYAPKMLTMHIDPGQASARSSARAASVIQKIVAEYRRQDRHRRRRHHPHCRCRRREPATPPRSASTTSSSCPRWAQLYYGRVVRLMTSSAPSWSWLPARTAWCTSPSWPTSASRRWRTWCKIGDMMWVKVTEIDEKGRVEPVSQGCHEGDPGQGGRRGEDPVILRNGSANSVYKEFPMRAWGTLFSFLP